MVEVRHRLQHPFPQHLHECAFHAPISPPPQERHRQNHPKNLVPHEVGPHGKLTFPSRFPDHRLQKHAILRLPPTPIHSSPMNSRRTFLLSLPMAALATAAAEDPKERLLDGVDSAKTVEELKKSLLLVHE